MTKELFDVCLTGNLLTGHNRREVSVNLAQLVGTSIPQAESLLATATCVKSQVDEPTAAYYRDIIEETGAEAVIRACLDASAVHLKPQPEPVPAAPWPEAVGASPGLPDKGSHVPPRAEAVPVPASAAPPRAPAPPPGFAPLQVSAPPLPVTDAAQPIEEEATPVLDEDAQERLFPLLDSDTTQPFTTPVPAPLRRPHSRWLGIAAIALAAVALGVMLVGVWLPAPVAPGQAIARVGESLNLVQPYQQQVEMFWRQQGRPPASGSELQWPGPVVLEGLAQVTLKEGGVLQLTFSGQTPVLEGQTLLLRPAETGQGIAWDCSGGSLTPLERPLECRPASMQ